MNTNKKRGESSSKLTLSVKGVINMLEDHYNFYKSSILNSFIFFLILVKNRSNFVGKIVMLFEKENRA